MGTLQKTFLLLQKVKILFPPSYTTYSEDKKNIFEYFFEGRHSGPQGGNIHHILLPIVFIMGKKISGFPTEQNVVCKVSDFMEGNDEPL
jgi:hypothetical protein